MLTWTKWAGWLAVVLGAMLSASAFMGWTQSGAVVRDSFQTFRAAQILGLDELTPLRVVWFVLPVLPMLVAALTLVDRRRWAGAVLVFHALSVSVVAVVVLASGVAGGVGATLGLVTGIAATSLGSWMVLSRSVAAPLG